MIDAIQIYEAPASFLPRFLNGRAELAGMLSRVLWAVARHGNSVTLERGG